MCSCPPQALITGASTLRDFRVGGICPPLCQEDLLKVFQVCGGQRLKSTGYSWVCQGIGIPISSHLFTWQRCKRRGRQAQSSVVNALPMEAASAAAALVIVAASAGALMWMNQDKLGAASSEKEKCEACDGSGLCPGCKGEGFQLKDLSAEAVERARANASNAATRYTAGLAKKWSYCANCSGARSCPACEGRGRLTITRSGN